MVANTDGKGYQSRGYVNSCNELYYGMNIMVNREINFFTASANLSVWSE